MRCAHCGANNHSANHLCLECGAELRDSDGSPLVPARSSEPFAPREEEERSDLSLLADAGALRILEAPAPEQSNETYPPPPSIESIRGFSYLFQEEPRAPMGRYLLLVLFVLGIGIAAWQWRELRALADRVSGPDTSASSSAAPVAVSPSHTVATPETQDSSQKQVAPETASTSQESPSEVPKARIEPASERIPVANTWEEDGEKYLYGNGVAVNCELAQKNLLTAAKHSSAKAESELGAMYATGHCVLRDLPLAYRWFARAQHQAPRDRRIAEDMRVLWNQMSSEEQALASR